MTAGSYSMDNFVPDPGTGSWYGTKGSKVWNGTDSPRSPYVAARYSVIIREVWSKKLKRTVLKELKCRVPGYRPKRLKSKDPHPYSMEYIRQLHTKQPKHNPPDGTFRPGLWCLASVVSPWSTSNPPLLNDNDQLKLVGRLIDQLQGSDFNMSVFLGEGHQTLGMLADTAIRVRKAISHARRLDVLGAARSLFEGTNRQPLRRHDWRLNKPGATSAHNSANLWLELQYGWKPLLNDAYGMAQSLAHAMLTPFTQTYRANVRRETSRSASAINFEWTYSCDVYRMMRRSLIAKISEDENSGAAARLGLLDPELVAWELLPFSFVADWFIPIGQWMEMRAKAGRLHGTFITSDKQIGFVANVERSGIPLEDFYCQVRFDRTISTTLKVPMPSFKPLDKVASWQHCANAVALATQMFLPRKRGTALEKEPGYNPSQLLGTITNSDAEKVRPPAKKKK